MPPERHIFKQIYIADKKTIKANHNYYILSDLHVVVSVQACIKDGSRISITISNVLS